MPRIGVTGHRKLADVAAIEAGVDAALAAIEARFPNEPLRILSSLAEGADRLVAQRILACSGARLVVVLPLPRLDCWPISNRSSAPAGHGWRMRLRWRCWRATGKPQARRWGLPRE